MRRASRPPQRLALSTVSRRSRAVESFKVMDVLRTATALEAQGRRVLHLEVGQPATGAPGAARRAAQQALEANAPLGYTPAAGLDSLRRRIAAWYKERHGADVDEKRVVVTTGSSAGFLLAFSALFDINDAVAVPTTAYPCYRNVLRAIGCTPVELVGGGASSTSRDSARRGFESPTAADLAELVVSATRGTHAPIRGLVLSSPSNPTGATLDDHSLRDLAEACSQLGVRFVSDEIYHHIEYGNPLKETKRLLSAVDLPGAIVVNSFSKYFSMTGWRVGWLVLPKDDDALGTAVETLQQNLAICAPAVSQVAATASFDDADGELRDHVTRYAANRGIVLDGLRRLGIQPEHVAPADGAFYCYVDVGAYGIDDAAAFCAKLLDETGIAVTPGLDFEFDPTVGRRRIRISYCGSDVAEAMDKLATWWPQR